MTVDGVAYKDEEYAPTLMTESHKQGDEVIDAGEMEVELGSHGDGLWGRFPCCVGCVSFPLIIPLQSTSSFFLFLFFEKLPISFSADVIDND